MKFEKKNIENQQVELVVETDADSFGKSKAQAARAISREAKIPGFRPGKAPYDVVKRIYGEEFIEERAVDIMINDLYPKLIKEADLKPYGPGKLDEVLEKNPPKFKLTIPLEPSVELGDYKGIKMAYKLPETTEKDVEVVLKNLQTNYATPEDVDRKAEKGDLVFCRINAVLAKPEKDEDAQILKDTPHQVILGEEEEENPFPYKGFADNLAGLASGEGEEIPRDKDVLERLSGEVDHEGETDEAVFVLVGRLDDLLLLEDGFDAVDPLGGAVIIQFLCKKLRFRTRKAPFFEPDSQVPFKSGADCPLDFVEGRGGPQLPVETGDPLLDGVYLFGFELLDGDPEAPQHGVDVEVDEHGALEKKRIVAFGPAGAGYLPSVDLDVVPGTEGSPDAQEFQGCDDGVTERLEESSRRNGRVEEGFLADHFPAELAFVEKKRTSTRDAAIDLDSAGAAVLDSNLFFDGLVVPDEHRLRLELQEVDGIGGLAGSLHFQEHVVQGHVLGRRHGRSIEQPPGFHLFAPDVRFAPAGSWPEWFGAA